MRRVTVIQKIKAMDAVFEQVTSLQLYCNSRRNSGVWSLLHHNRIVQCVQMRAQTCMAQAQNCAKGKISIKISTNYVYVKIYVLATF